MTTLNPTAPTHRLYCVRGNGENSRWTEIGAAWPNRDGRGFTFRMSATPLAGRVVMREIKREAANGAGGLQ